MEFFEVQSPSIRDRLRYNQPPSDSEKLAIQASIHVAQARLIEPPSSTVEAAQIQAYIAQYSSLLAPIRRLPVDILRAIFLQPFAHPNNGRKPDAWTSIIVQYKPNTLGAVCFHWRCVTCETAPLWSHLIVLLNRPSRPTIDGLRIALRRAQNVPLDLDFHSLCGMSWSAQDSDMMQEVLSHSERWSRISLILDSSLLQQLSPAQNRLQNLHALTLSGDTIDSFSLPRTLVFSNAPKLRILKVVHILSGTELPPLPWQQLTELCVDLNRRDNPELYHHAVLQGINIRQLSLRLDSNPPSLPHVVSSSVQKIIMYGPLAMNQHEMKGLDRITTPRLTDLRLVNCRYWDLPVIQAFVRRSSFNLQTLMLHSVPIRARDLSLLLGLVQTVETLHLEDLNPNAITNEVADALNANISPAPLLPGLTALTVSGTYLSDFGKVLALVESRLTPPIHISRVAVLDITLFNVGFSVQSLQRLHSFRVTQGFRFLSVDEAGRSMTMQFGFTPHIRWVGEVDLER